jgi:hypothetical protein
MFSQFRGLGDHGMYPQLGGRLVSLTWEHLISFHAWDSQPWMVVLEVIVVAILVLGA